MSFPESGVYKVTCVLFNSALCRMYYMADFNSKTYYVYGYKNCTCMTCAPFYRKKKTII